MVIPTKKGRRRAQEILRARAAALDGCIAGFPLDHKMALEAAVDAMLAALTRKPADARRVCRLCDEDACRPSGCPVETKAKGFNAQSEGDKQKKLLSTHSSQARPP